MDREIMDREIMDRDKKILVGCSGWSYPHWKGRFYPQEMKQDQWFDFYRSSFDTVEINNTFYKLPEEEVFQKWEKQAGSGFVYAVKVNRYITHMKKLNDPEEPLKKFTERVRLLGRNLGPLLYQLPPHWSKNIERLENFLGFLPDDLIHVFEFRDRSWMEEDVISLLNAHGCSFCIHDMIPCPRKTVGPVTFLRFHGTQGKYQGGYPRSALEEWAEWIKGQTKDVYVYFNNDALAHAVYDARQLKECLKAG